MSLERMDDLFGVTELVKQLDDAESVAGGEKTGKHGEVEIVESK